MTLRQRRTLKELPNTHFNISKAMRKAGYSQQTSVSGQQYERIRKKIEEEFKLADINADYVLKGLKVKAEQAKSDADQLRALELLGKYLALFTEKSEVKSDVTIQQKQEMQDYISNRLKDIELGKGTN